MFLFRQHDSDAVYGVLIDVSSGSVGVAIAESKLGEEIPKIIYAYRNTMRITKHGGEKSENLRRIRETLFSASLVLSQDGSKALREYNEHAKVLKLYVSCSAPWSHTIAREVYYEDNEPFKITQSIINDLVLSAETEILDILENTEKISDEGFTIVERISTNVSVNDYFINNPLAIKGTSLGVTHTVGLIPQDILDSIDDTREKLFKTTELHRHTRMLTMHVVNREIFPKVSSVLMVDISGEATELAVIDNNVLVENISMPFGSNTLIRKIMDETGKPASDVESLLHSANDEGAHIKDQVVSSYEKEFSTQFSVLTASILENRAIPSQIILTCDPRFKNFFFGLIMKHFSEGSNSKREITLIDEDSLQKICTMDTSDVHLSFLARFFHISHKKDELNSH